MMTDLTIRVTAALEGLERRVAVLETKASDAANNRSTVISNPYFGQENSYPSYGGVSPAETLETRTLETLETQNTQMEATTPSRLPRRPSHDENVAAGVFHGSGGAAGVGSIPMQMHMLMPASGPPARSTDLDFVGEISSSHFASYGDNTANLITNYAGDSFVGRGYASSPVLAPRHSDELPQGDGPHTHARNLPQRVSPHAMLQAQRGSGVAVCEALTTNRSAESAGFSTTHEEPAHGSNGATIQSKVDPGVPSLQGGMGGSAIPPPLQKPSGATSPEVDAGEGALEGPRHVYHMRPISTAAAAATEQGNNSGKNGAVSPEVAMAPSDPSTPLPETAALDSFSTAGTPPSVHATDSVQHAAVPHSGSSRGSPVAGAAVPDERWSTPVDAPEAVSPAASGQRGACPGGSRVVPDVNPQIAALLARQDDLAMLRLLQALYSPCWELLEPSVARGLLSTFCKYAPAYF